MKKTYTTLILVLFINFLFSQKETNYWYFGEQAGLFFNNGPPIAITNGALYASEGTATISDINGNLLFYTDGVTVWNKNHQIMTNGTGLLGSDNSTQSSIIIPQPLSDSLYYIFTASDQAGYWGSYGGFAYSIVNMSLQGGNGEVTTKNVQLITPTSEKVTAVHHSNGTDIWVMTQQFGTNSKYAWLITSTGLNPTPIISSIGALHNWTTNYNDGAQGYMKFSPDGTKLASIIPSTSINIELFDFNNSTGVVSNPIFINGGELGLEFSSDGSKLYATTFSSEIYQWNLALGTQTLINNSKTLIHQTPYSPTMDITSGLQLGIDCRIYVARNSNDTIGVIQNPNEIGLLCNYNHNGIPLQGKYTEWGLPNFIQSYFKDCKEIGVNSISFQPSFSVYPNPFSSEILITIEKQSFNQAILIIRDILNQIVFNDQKKYFSNNYQNRINLSFLPNGIYFIDLTIDGNRTVKKIVKE